MEHGNLLSPTIVFDPPASSPERRHRRRHHRRRRVLPFPLRGDWDTDSATDYSSDSESTSSDDEDGVYLIDPYHRRRKPRHKHIHLPAGLPLGIPNTLVRRSAAAAEPRNYGYRRLHYQGGQERRGRPRTRRGHCHAIPTRKCQARSPQRNILVRCGRWLLGDSRRCYCGRKGCGGGCCAPATGCCDDEGGRSRSPTRHREEEYWGPGTKDWAYGPRGRNANWRDTPWSYRDNGGTNTYNFEPGAIVEEVEEGGTFPIKVANAAVADQTHNHYHIGTNGRRRRSSQRKGVRSYMRDYGVLGFLDQERDRELDRNMVDRQIADRERDRELDRNIMDRETAKQRDHHLLALLDRERDPDCGGNSIIELLDQELGRKRDLYAETNTKRRSKKSWKASKQSSENEEGLGAEIEALRHDIRKLLRSTSTNRVSDGIKEDEGSRSAVSGAALRSSGRRKPSADIHFTHGRTIDDGDGEDVDEDSASSPRRVFDDGDTETD